MSITHTDVAVFLDFDSARGCGYGECTRIELVSRNRRRLMENCMRSCYNIRSTKEIKSIRGLFSDKGSEYPNSDISKQAEEVPVAAVSASLTVFTMF